MPVPKGVSKEKYDSCVRQVKKESPDVNAYAVCADKLSKTDSKISVKEAVDKILHDKWEVQDVLPKVEESKRDDVLQKLREMDKKDVKVPHGHAKAEKAKGKEYAHGKKHEKHHSALQRLIKEEEKEHGKDLDKDGKIGKSDFKSRLDSKLAKADMTNYKIKTLPGGTKIYAEGPHQGKEVGSIRGKRGESRIMEEKGKVVGRTREGKPIYAKEKTDVKERAKDRKKRELRDKISSKKQQLSESSSSEAKKDHNKTIQNLKEKLRNMKKSEGDIFMKSDQLKKMCGEMKKMQNDGMKKTDIISYMAKKYSDEEAKKAYSALNKMQKSIEEYVEAIKSGEITLEEFEKSVEETKEEMNKSFYSEETNGGKVSEIKFEDGLFQEFRLGATLKQGPAGNYIQDAKEFEPVKVKTIEKK